MPKSSSIYLKVLTIVSSIIGILAFAFAVTTYLRNQKLEETNRKRQEQFLKVTEELTNTLAEKEDRLRVTTDRLERQANLLGNVETTLGKVEQRVDAINERVDTIHDRVTSDEAEIGGTQAGTVQNIYAGPTSSQNQAANARLAQSAALETIWSS